MKCTYIVLVDVLVRDGLDAELIHANADVLARRVIAGTAGKWRVDAIGVLKGMLVRYCYAQDSRGATYPVGLGRQVAPLVDALGRVQRILLLGGLGALATRAVRHCGW
jgi:hypothetical protein